MSKYFFTYLALMFFAASLAVADETMHSGEPPSKTAREADPGAIVAERSTEVDNALGLSIVDALENIEIGLGKRRSTGEMVEIEED